MDPQSGQCLSRSAARRFDQVAEQDYGLPGRVLMENAGRGAAACLRYMGLYGPVVVACGKGNNGGDGLVAARYLESWGYELTVLIFAARDQLSPDAAANLRPLERAGTRLLFCPGPWFPEDAQRALSRCGWIIDALLGTGTRGDPQPPIAGAIDWLNQTTVPKIALDVPSGLDADSGLSGRPTVRARDTLTFVAWKRGFLNPSARDWTGKIQVIDLGTPKSLLAEILTWDHNPPDPPDPSPDHGNS